MTFLLGILGPGTLGLSLAQWAAECGVEVRLYGRDPQHAARGLAEVERRWGVLIQKGKLEPHTAEAARRHLSAGDEAEGFDALDALLEALPEDPATKIAAWRHLGPRLSRAIALTGSSALPVAPIARAAGLEGRMVGFHLFVPVRTMKALELVVPEGTAPETLATAERLGALLHKRAVRVKDGPGYAAARMALAQGVETMRLLEEGVADAAGLDALMTGGYGHPVGPLELSDRVGLDLRLVILRRLFEATADPRFRPPEILERLVAEGHLGKRSGRGFHEWTQETP